VLEKREKGLHNESRAADNLGGCGIDDVCDDCAAIFSLCKAVLTQRETLVVRHETLIFLLCFVSLFCASRRFAHRSKVVSVLQLLLLFFAINNESSARVSVCIRRRRLFVTWKRRHRQKHELFLVSHASSFACRVARCAACHFLRVGSFFSSHPHLPYILPYPFF